MNQQFAAQAIAATSAANVETMQSLAFASINAMERLQALNMEFVRNSLNVGADYVQPASEKSLQGLISRQSEGFQDATERTVAYLRSVYGISSGAQATVTTLLSSHIDELGDSMMSMIDKMAPSAPAGSENALAIVKSAIANGRSAYNQFIKTAQSVTEANLPEKAAKKKA